MLDRDQQAVVDHPGGPVLVLAGPGTGKTTTLVEAVVDRVGRRGLAPEQVLVLTFSRKAADELRARISARLARTTAGATASTFHSFCYALVRRFADPELYAQPPALLSAPEHDVRLRDLLKGSVETGRVAWPDSVRPALSTRGLAGELRGLLARSRSLRLDPEDVTAAGVAHARPEWVAAGQFLGESLEVLDGLGVLDYTELVHRATVIASDPAHRATLRRELGFVVVDEYQDTDPAQVALLEALAGDGRDLLVVGDPDQSIYGFRGSDVRGLLDFPDRFRTAAGERAPMLALRTARRSGTGLLRASRSVAARLPVPGRLDHETFRAFRDLHSGVTDHGDGQVDVRTFVSPAAEAESIAELLRRSHLDQGLPWSQMAVLVRSGVQSIPRLHRALTAAGVPVEVAGDELPLRAQPAVQVLVRALRAADALARPAPDRDRSDSPALRPDEVEALLTSPVGQLGPAAVRRLARTLRERDRADHTGMRPPLPSARLLADAVAKPDRLADLSGPDATRGLRAARLLARAADQLRAGAAVEECLWTLWDGTGWPAQLRRTSTQGGSAGRAAARDLDAVCALFDLAARAQGRQQRRGVGAFLDEVEAQQIPADTLAERGVRGAGVRLLTAHRSKGLEWRLVVVAGVQEGGWPALRRRGSLLATDLLGPDGELPALPSTAELLAEERRLFYVAVTRARQRLVVTAVRGIRDGGDQPSRLLDELGVPVGPVEGRPRRPLSLRGLLGELRSRAEATDDPAERAALARRIARLAASGVLPAADPDQWWGLREVSAAAVPVRATEEPVALSGSAVRGIEECALRWFLAREAGGESQSTSAQGFGSIVHALAAAVLDGEVAADADALLKELDRVWGQLQFPVSWASDAERQEAVRALGRFLRWHDDPDRRRHPLAAELTFDVTVPVGGDTARLRGSMDRVELDAEGRAVVVDLKTGKTPPTEAALRRDAQLGVYQLAVAVGAADEAAGSQVQPGGAELVQLRKELARGIKVQHQPPDSPEAPLAASAQVAAAVDVLRSERFAARVGPGCGRCEFQPVCPAQPAGQTLLGDPARSGGPEAPEAPEAAGR